MENQKQPDRSPAMKAAFDGEMLREYGKSTFLVVREALNIDRVRFELCPVGQNGKNTIQFFLPVHDFLELTTEIRNGVFAKKCAADASSAEPKAYSYVTGENGHLRLAIGGGRVGIRVKMADTATKKSLNIAVSEKSLKKMAMLFFLYSGLTQAAPRSYYGELFEAFCRGCKYRQKQMEQARSQGGQQQGQKKPQQANQTQQPQPPHGNASQGNGEKAEAGSFSLVILQTDGKPHLKNGKYGFRAKLGSQVVGLVADQKVIESKSWFKQFLAGLEKADKAATVKGTKLNNIIVWDVP